ncbi:AAA domain-containing protein [Spirosoma terrae]|uniref:DUF4011 domain-containing protein n=1 Tax=Spirosoma terrae TaxID=1968276 RepID=A0A6L9KYZ3_9BACT|nr:AAA domain-containing protein [Spirosoma terrae]NDU93455.1 DUF4011 domain-containing protein [Spirosoma terrae]
MNQHSVVLRAFRRRLTNLSSRNRSLLLASLPANQFLDLHDADFLLQKPSFSLIADLIEKKSAISICDVLDARQERSNEVSAKLRKIARTARFITEERGTEDLFVGWPFVRGKFLDETVVHTPLLFFPVALEQHGKSWKLLRRGDELAFLNPTFALAYGHFNQVKIPEDTLRKTVDEFDRDALSFRTQLYEWLKSSPFELNFNQDLFVDKLQFFNKLSSKSLNQLEHAGELKLYPEAVLGIFPQAGSFLVPDYDALLETNESDEADNLDVLFPFLSDSTTDQPYLPENKIHTPLPLDSSQEAALRLVKAGQSLVIQGPPGTGKSQLIANLMADAAASGKRVLLVCQKRAALDVVNERLSQVGMAPFLALIHDFQDDRRTLYQQIANQISSIDDYRQQNSSLNTVLLERDFDRDSRQIDEVVTELTTFKYALFDTSECGVSIKELYLTSDPAAVSIPLDDTYPQFHIDNVDNFVQRLVAYQQYQQQLPVNHPWFDRVSFADFSSLDLTKIEQVINRWQSVNQNTRSQFIELLGYPISLDQVVDWQAYNWELTALLTTIDTASGRELWPTIQFLRNNTTHAAYSSSKLDLEQLAQQWDNVLLSPGPEQSLNQSELSFSVSLLNDALQARSSWLRWTMWQLTDSRKEKLNQLATANNLTLSENDLRILLQKIEKRLQLEEIQLQADPLFDKLPLPASPTSLRLLRHAVHVAEQLNDLTPLRNLPLSAWLTAQTFSHTITALLRLVIQVEAQYQQAQLYLTDNQLQILWKDDRHATVLLQSLRQDFDLLVESDRLYNGFSQAELSVLKLLVNSSSSHWASIFQNSLRLAWINHIEQKYPLLRSVSSLRLEQLEHLLQECIERKQALSRDILITKLRSQTYKNLLFNRLNNAVTYRDLFHQTTKKRSIWPVRKLMESFADEVFKLVPCWLASPESVSAMFPLQKGLFDLVIFDEASQCFAENGIPAMFRGKQVVVTGDSQQLRPSDLYKVQLDEMEVENEPTVQTVLEIESLLELASQQLPQVSLTEHYRSRTLDLITFSNRHFYKNKLQLLPYFDDVNRQEPAIHYVNVKGIWKQNTNLAEAEAVLALLERLAIENPLSSVGIVTFNYPQQQLIQELLEGQPFYNTANSQNNNKVISSLFVKNIENVQGDERDIIIFSVGYAPDDHGRINLQFGSLNAAGGTNRLNVAITRAREQVYVITSLWPQQLAVENVTNDGPRLLKAYLAYAQNVAQGNFQSQSQLNTVLGTNVLLKDRLAHKHPDWQRELPFADLTVKRNGFYESLVLTDDEAYYQQSIKQSHAYLPVSLQTRRWPFKRHWSREYWQGRC